MANAFFKSENVRSFRSNCIYYVRAGVVATNAQYNKTELTKIAQMAHDGLARAVRPSHTMYDGDTIFAVSVSDRAVKARPSVTTIGSISADVFAEAIVQAVKHAEGIADLPSYNEWSR